MKYLYWLLLLAPIAVVAELVHGSPLLVFSLSAAAIIPLSGVLGAAQLAGGLRFKTQKFNPRLAGTSVSLLLLAVIGLVVPAVFLHTHPDPQRVSTIRMSEFVAVLLVAGYGLSLVYSM